LAASARIILFLEMLKISKSKINKNKNKIINVYIQRKEQMFVNKMPRIFWYIPIPMPHVLR
jgi:hypothetical protein